MGRGRGDRGGGQVDRGGRFSGIEDRLRPAGQGRGVEAPVQGLRGGGDQQVGRGGRGGGGDENQAGPTDRQNDAGGSRGGREVGGREERAQRARAWVFTLNNYRDVPKELPKGSPKVKYLCFGREVSPSGTPHLQGYVVFENAVIKPSETFKKFGKGWFEVARGSAEDNIKYTGKDGDFFEFGQRPQNQLDQGHHGFKGGRKGKSHGSKGGEMEIQRWENAWDSAKRGALEEIPADIRLRHYNTIVKVAARYSRPPAQLDNLGNKWIWGETGTGKSRYIFENHPGAYIKEANKWWDGYREDDPAHKTVLIDDLHPKWSEKERLKNWGDRYPFMAEIKGGSILIRPARILITSNYHPREVRDRTRQQKQFWRCFLAILRCFLRPTWVQL